MSSDKEKSRLLTKTLENLSTISSIFANFQIKIQFFQIMYVFSLKIVSLKANMT